MLARSSSGHTMHTSLVLVSYRNTRAQVIGGVDGRHAESLLVVGRSAGGRPGRNARIVRS